MSRQKQSATPVSTSDKSSQGMFIPAPALYFSDTARTLKDIIKEHPPHCVIRCASLPDSGKNAYNSNFDLNQPLLAYMTRSVRKVSAHSLTFDNQRGEFVPVGNGLLIPEDYPGWFAVLGSPNTAISHQSVPHYTKLSLMAVARCSHFLIGGKDPIHGLMVQNDENGKVRRSGCSVLPGTVLRKAGLYREEKSATKEKRKKKKSKDVPQREFLRCFDEQDREMFIYTRQEGTFYMVAKDETSISPKVLQMQDILRYKFPLVVKLIYGRVPTTPCAFTQVLLLTDRGISRTLVASTLLCYKNINVEIPLDTELKFHVATNTSGLLTSKAYIRALEMCKEQAPSYIKDMKVVFGNSQLAPEEVAKGQTKTNQKEQVADTSQSLPGGSSQVCTHTTPVRCQIADQCSVREVARMSVLTEMSDLVVVSHETFVIADQPSPSQTRTARKEGTTTTLQDTGANISLVSEYNPPSHHVINVNPRPVIPRSLTPPEPDRVYDNNLHNSRDQTENSTATLVPSSSSSSSPVVVISKDDHSNGYLSLWGALVGRPVSPARTPVVDIQQVEYVTMEPKTKASTPKPHLRKSDLHKAALSPTSEAPPVSARGRTPSSYSENSSVNDSDSLTSLSEDSWSLSDWATDEDYVNITDLKRVENPICENDPEPDEQHAHSEDGTPTYLELDSELNAVLCSTARSSQRQRYELTDLLPAPNGYIQPYHVDYQKSRTQHSADPGYTQPDKGVDSGVYDDEPGYSKVESLDALNTNHLPNNLPRLPPRPPQPMTLGQAVLRGTPTPTPGASKFLFTQFNKEVLVSELRKTGITPATEIALAGLKMADIANILSKDEEFDDDLFALLPQVSLIELKMIAACFRGLRLRT